MSIQLEAKGRSQASVCGAAAGAARQSWRAGGLLAVLGLFAAAGTAQVAPSIGAPPSPTRLAREKLPAAGRQITELEIGQFGRYSIRTESKQGVALQLVDRMSGPGEVVGETGKQDGRLDLFLDRGIVRLVTLGPKLGRGDVRLSVAPFREAQTAATRLPELRSVSVELGDLEQISWWIEIPERRQVVLEAAGRYLADLRLWQGGSWLIDAMPETSTIEPVSGRPLQLCRLTADLAPGLYRLVAYGGPGMAWARGGREKPLHLRWGIPLRAEAGRERMSIGPFGFERFLLPGSATFVQLELPEAAAATLEVADFDSERPFEAWGASGEITAETVPPLAQLRRQETDGRAVVTVRGAVGQSYTLQHFRAERVVELSGDGDYWIGTVHAGAAGDSVDASAVLFEQGQQRTAAIAGYVPEIGARKGWARRFNLLDEASLFLRVVDAGEYVLDLRGAAQVRLEPLLLSPPEGYETPPLRAAPTSWTLDPGLYVLTLVPLEQGIVDTSIRRKGFLDPLLDWVGLGKEPPPSPARGAVQMAGVRLSRRVGYTLLVSHQPGVEVGPLARKLPLDLAEALPLSLLPEQQVEVVFRNATRARLAAPAEDGTALEMSLDGGAWESSLAVEPGTHRVRVRSQAHDTVFAALSALPEERSTEGPLPVLDPATLAALPAFPTLVESSPQTFDLERREARTLLVEAASPALYTLETTGLLATSGSVRTRVQPRLASAEQNGTGRNVSLRSYLREGSYQFTVQALGESAGHLGARLRRAEVREGGHLADGVAARAELRAGETIAYGFRVEQEGDFALHSLRLGAHLDLRLEDAQGFPPAAPVLSGDTTVHLLPGDYRLYVLPQAVTTRSVTSVTRVPTAVERQGHGPFDLALERLDGNLWLEPSNSSEPRLPDRWRFALPASSEVAIALDGEMEAELWRLDGSSNAGEKVAFVPPGRGYTGELAAGKYELAVRCSRRNSQVRYTLKVSPSALVDGLARQIEAPAMLPVAVGQDGLVEISSSGGNDVRGRLYDAAGNLLADGDDRPGDWNFLLARRLAPGRYRLRVDAVGTASAPTRVEMRLPRERDEEPWKLPEPRTAQLTDEALRIPLRLPAAADLLAIVAVAAEPLGLELERRAGDRWESLAAAEGTTPRLLLPLVDGPQPTLRLRVRSLDRRPGTVRLAAFAGRAPRANEKALAAGLDLPRLPGLLPPLAAAAVTLDRPGCFAVANGPEDLLHARRPGEPLTAQPGALVGDGGLVWLAAPAEGGGSLRVVARRAEVGREPLSLRLASGEQVRCDLATGKGSAFVEARALAGDPLVAAVLAGEAPGFERSTLAGRHRAAALAAPGANVAVVRNAGNAAIELRLSALPLAGEPAAASAEAAGAASVRELRLAPASARLVSLPGGAKTVRTALAEGTAAWTGGSSGKSSRSDALAWADDEAIEHHQATEATTAIVVNPTDDERVARLEVRPLDSDDVIAPLAPGTRIERRFRRGGALRVPVAAGHAGATLHVRGAESTVATLFGADGSVTRGEEMPFPAAGGTLELRHPAGLVALWSEGTARDLAAFGFADATVEKLPGATTVALSGSARILEVEIREPSLLSLRSATPLAVALLGAGQVSRFEPGQGDTAFDATLAPGAARFAVRALAGEPLAGRLEITVTPLSPLGEGLGAAILLPPGGARGYTFRVDHRGPVGVGVRTDEGAVETAVFAPDGSPLGRGVVQWLELEPGTYGLVLAASAEGAPVVAQPAVVGVSPPGNGPPREVIQQFLALERGGPPPATSGVQGSEQKALPFGKHANREIEEQQRYEESEDSEQVEGDEDGGEQ